MNAVPSVDPRASLPRQRPWVMVLALLFCAEAAFIALFVSPVSHGIDFYHVQFAPAAVRAGFDIYDPADHPAIVQQIDQSIQRGDSKRLDVCVDINRRLYASGFCPTATPFLYAIHSWLLVGPFDVRYWMFHLVATAASFVGIYLTGRAASMSRSAAWLTSGLVNSFCWGLFLDAQLANVSRIQLFGLGLAMWLAVSHRRAAMFGAGLVLAVGCAYKPTIVPSLLLLIAVLSVDGRWREALQSLVGMFVGGVAAFLTPGTLFSSLDCWWHWKAFAGSELTHLAHSFPGNYSLMAVLTAHGPAWLSVLPWVLAGLLAIVFGLTAAGRTDTEDQPDAHRNRVVLAIAVGPLWTILASPLTWVQYSALAMPIAVALLGLASRARQGRTYWLVSTLICTMLAGGLIQRFFRVDSHRVDCGLFWIGWIGLLLIAVAMIASTGRTNAASMSQRVADWSWRRRRYSLGAPR